ncbi:hypothetical protein DDZ18_01435 [Marinicauda salina]|uniref:Uncharacterized protein n=1 Tax=Marinicauda salina TaxID=2135793 RepID=A0A2U2BWA0_9PROT|nr:hypothetical protein [Marinicauda salina]PWE18296.1 hypothetical protein DDZ18_01435 [Marinicauda salina]
MKLAAAAALAGAAALFTGAAQAQCFAMFDDESAEPQPIDGYTVVDASAEPGLMERPPAPEDAAGILCSRDTIVPDANDFEILYHMPLYIRAGQGEETTVLALGFSDGNYVVQLPQGEITEDERAAIVAALEGFNEGEAALQAYMAEQEAEESGQGG